MDPTLSGFQYFITNVMGIDAQYLPMTAPVIKFAFNFSMNYALPALRGLPNFDPSEPNLFAVAVYNLAGHFLVTFAQDTPPSTYFADLRKKYGLNTFTGGVVSSTSDNGTSESMDMADFIKGLLPQDLALLKTPWGQIYLGLAANYGSIWGLT